LTDQLKHLLEIHFIIPFYAPGSCTDEDQECDTVVNKQFKGRIKAAFRDYLYGQYNAWVAGNNAEEWVPKFGMNELKPNITGWVQEGIAAISTPAMKLSIVKAFESDGRFSEIRTRVARQQVVEDNVALQELFDQWMLHDEPETIEEIASRGDLVPAHFVESDSDIDS
jgi:hypothetical protein